MAPDPAPATDFGPLKAPVRTLPTAMLPDARQQQLRVCTRLLLGPTRHVGPGLRQMWPGLPRQMWPLAPAAVSLVRMHAARMRTSRMHGGVFFALRSSLGRFNQMGLYCPAPVCPGGPGGPYMGAHG